MSDTKVCNICKITKPATKNYFGHTPNGSLRNQCRECKKAYSKRYDAVNKISQTARNELRLERGGHMKLNDQQCMALLSNQKGLCLCCGEKILSYKDSELDHGIPIAQGGANKIENLYLAHPQCNTEKHAKTLEEHWAWRERIGLELANKPLLIQLLSNLINPNTSITNRNL